jgi:hypothetical protein
VVGRVIEWSTAWQLLHSKTGRGYLKNISDRNIKNSLLNEEHREYVFVILTYWYCPYLIQIGNIIVLKLRDIAAF